MTAPNPGWFKSERDAGCQRPQASDDHSGATEVGFDQKYAGRVYQPVQSWGRFGCRRLRLMVRLPAPAASVVVSVLVFLGAGCSRVATIGITEAYPRDDLSGLEIPEGAPVSLSDSRVLLVRGPKSSHDDLVSVRSRGPVLALDGREWKQVADPPPFEPTMYHTGNKVLVLDDDRIAVVGTECEGARQPDAIPECDDAYVQVVSVLDTSSGDWSERVEFEVPNTDHEPQTNIVASEGDDLLVHATGGAGALVWVNPSSGATRPADGFIPWQDDSICDLGGEGVMQVINRTSIEQLAENRVDPNDAQGDQKGVSTEAKQSKLEVVVSKGGGPAELVTTVATESRVTPDVSGTPIACGDGNFAVFTGADPSDPAGNATVEVRGGPDFGVVTTFEVPAAGSGLKVDPPAVVNSATAETTLLSPDLTELTLKLDDTSRCVMHTLNDDTYCQEDGRLRRVS